MEGRLLQMEQENAQLRAAQAPQPNIPVRPVNPISLVDYTEDYSEGSTEHTGETQTVTLQDMSMGRTLRARERLGPKVDLMGAFINTDNNDHTWFPKDKAHAITQRSVRSRQNNEGPDLRARLSHRRAETTVVGP